MAGDRKQLSGLFGKDQSYEPHEKGVKEQPSHIGHSPVTKYHSYYHKAYPSIPRERHSRVFQFRYATCLSWLLLRHSSRRV